MAARGPLAVTKQAATTYLLVFLFSAATGEEERKKEGSRRRRSRSRRWRRRRQGRRRKRTEDRVLHESCGTCHELPQQKRSFFKQVIVLAEEARTSSSEAVLGSLWGSGGAFGRVWGAPGRPLGRSGAAFGEPRGGPRAILGQLEEQSDIGATSRPILRPKRVRPGGPRGTHLGGQTASESI